MSAKVAELKRQIEEAFPGAAVDARAVVPHERDSEYREVKAAFAGKRWTELSAAVVAAHRESLPLLTPAAFRHLFPAFLIASLGAERDLSFNNLDELAPPVDPAGLARFEERTGPFSQAQRKALAGWLRWVKATQADDVPADQLERALQHWEALPS